MDKLTIKTENIVLKLNTGSIVVPGGTVQSVNGKTGIVTLDANDVSAEPQGSVVNLKTYVDDQDALKANISYVDSEVEALQSSITLKANSEYVDQQDQLLLEQIDSKANAQAVNQALSTKADLDESGKVPASQLPSYVDDVLDGRYVNPSQFNDLNGNPYTPESGKVYIDIDSNKTYRWSGMLYVVIGGGGVALGETSETAYRGDRGKIAYDHSQSQGNPHNSTTSDITEGSRQYFTPLRVRATDLTGYTLGTNNPITAADTVLSAFGQAQAQIGAIISSFQTNVRGTALTGLNTNLTGDVDASQTFLTAIGRFQGKFNALGGTIRNTILTGLDVSSKNAVIPSDPLVVGVGKLQGQIDDLKSLLWINANTIGTFHPNISSSNLYFAKKDGMLYVRGSITAAFSIAADALLFEITDKNYNVLAPSSGASIPNSFLQYLAYGYADSFVTIRLRTSGKCTTAAEALNVTQTWRTVNIQINAGELLVPSMIVGVLLR